MSKATPPQITRAIYALATYNTETEAYDREVCTLRGEDGTALWATAEEQQLSCANARDVRQRLGLDDMPGIRAAAVALRDLSHERQLEYLRTSPADAARGTGRTTRMMHELIGYLTTHPQRKALLVCHSLKYASDLGRDLPEQLRDRVIYTSPNTLHAQALLGDEPRAAFVDHYAHEGWAVNKTNCDAVERLEEQDLAVRRGA